MDHIVVDVEIQKTIEETLGGWDATDHLGVAVACVWEYRTARMRVYGPDEVEALRTRLIKADRISGFDIFNFDFPVMWGINKQDWLKQPSLCLERQPGEVPLKAALAKKTDDMLRRIWQAKGLNPDNFDKRTHGGYSLNAVAEATLGVTKIGYGGDAPKWYQEGLTQKVANYCADGVAIERDLTDFVDRYGYVLCNRLGGRYEKLEIKPWIGGSI